MKEKKEEQKSRTIIGVLYPDDPSHVKAIQEIPSLASSWGYGLHDKDLNDEGELKKNHWHVILQFPNARFPSAVAKKLGIDARHLRAAKSFKGSLLYLIHWDNPDKYQYPVDIVQGPLLAQLKELIQARGTDSDRARLLFEYVRDSKSKNLTRSAIVEYALDNGLWDSYRRASSIFRDLIDEKNQGTFGRTPETLEAINLQLQLKINELNYKIEKLEEENKKLLQFFVFCSENENIMNAIKEVENNARIPF